MGFRPRTGRLLRSSRRARALRPEVWERVGRALTDYLAHSGEYGYTLDLRRQDTSLDPVMDFLVNVKQGHCERFASALALMLRSQGIPARVVVGFLGAAELGNGVYVVRENQAHAWVEMLAPERKDREPPAPPNGVRPYHPPDWLTLDPTPAGDATPPPYSLWDWWQDGERTGQQLWGGMVVNYNADEQAGLWATLQSPRFLNGLYRAGLALPALAGVAAAGMARPTVAPLTGGAAPRPPRTSLPWRSTPGCWRCWPAAPDCGRAPARRRASSPRRSGAFCCPCRRPRRWRTCRMKSSIFSTGSATAAKRRPRGNARPSVRGWTGWPSSTFPFNLGRQRRI